MHAPGAAVLPGMATDGPPHVTGAIPREAVIALLQNVVAPRFWPGEMCSDDIQFDRSRFTPGKEYSVIASTQLQPSGTKGQVLGTFGDADDLNEAWKESARQPYGALIYAPELGCIAEVLPSDWRLPYLARAMSSEYMLPQLLALSMPAIAASSLDVQVLRYRPCSRAVVLYSARGTDGSVVAEAVGKVYRSDGKAKRMWRLLESIYYRSHVEPIVPRPLALLKDDALVLMSKAAGRSLAVMLNEPDAPRTVEAIRMTALALRSFHDMPPGDLKTRKPSKTLDSIVKLAKRVQADARVSFDIRGLVRALEAREDLLTTPRLPSLVHGAFKPTAVLIDEAVATIVDLDSCSAGDPARDIGNFTAKLRAQAQQPGMQSLNDHADEFLSAYAGPEAFEMGPRVRLYEAIFLAGLGLKHLDAGWREPREAVPGLDLLKAARERLI